MLAFAHGMLFLHTTVLLLAIAWENPLAVFLSSAGAALCVRLTMKLEWPR